MKNIDENLPIAPGSPHQNNYLMDSTVTQRGQDCRVPALAGDGFSVHSDGL